jgi:hypothetical protein
VSDIKKVVEQIIRIAPNIKSVLNEGEAEEFLGSFELENGKSFFVSVWGSMPNNSRAEYEISVKYGDGNSYSWRQLNIAEGFSG